MRKIFTFILALIAAGMSLHVQGVEIKGIAYTLGTNTATVTQNQKMVGALSWNYYGDITIPETVEYNDVTYTVTRITAFAFTPTGSEPSGGVTSVSIPSTVTDIFSGAFSGCTKMTSITCYATTPPTCGTNCFQDVPTNIPVNVPEGTVAAYKANASWGVFGEYIQEIKCSLGSGNCGESGDNLKWNLSCSGVLTISGTGQMASYTTSSPAPWDSQKANVKSLVLGEGVTFIGNYAFNGCSALTKITAKATEAPTCGNYVFDGVDKNIPVSVPAGKAAEYKAKAGWKEFKNILIASGTCGAALTWTLGADSVLAISGTGDMTDWGAAADVPWDAYRLCIKTVVMEDGVTSIGGRAFRDCTNLTSVTIPNNVTSIGVAAFRLCTALKSLAIPNSVQSIGNTCFSGCSGLTAVNIPNSLTKIDEYTFNECSGLTAIEIPNGVKSLEFAAFTECTGLKEVIIPNSVDSIRGYAFDACTGLTAVTIGSGVNYIGSWAFRKCTNLASITSKASTPPFAGLDCFANVNTSIPVYVPEGTMTAYKDSAEWKNFTNYQEIFDPTGKIAYELVDLSTGTLTEGKYLIVFSDNKAHASIGTKGLIATSNVLPIIDNVAYLSEEADTCAVTIAPLGTDSFSILLPDGVNYLDQQAKNSITTSASAAGFAITDGGSRTVQIAKYLPAPENKTFILKQNGEYFRMYDNTMNNLPKLYRRKGIATGIETFNSQEPKAKSQKILRNGQIFILRDGKTYTVTGQEVK